jgi:DNA transposition AAA+ family ATPase
MRMRSRNELGHLAERLRSLYQMYGCESELPDTDCLVDKLEKGKIELIEAIQRGLNQKELYQTTPEKVLRNIKSDPLGYNSEELEDEALKISQSHNDEALLYFKGFNNNLKHLLEF